MAMTPRGWTINALAIELERDRRTIARKLAHVRPIEVRGRERYYLLRDALDAIEDDSPPSTPPRYDPVDLFEVDLKEPMVTRTWDEIRAIFGVGEPGLRRWVRYGGPFVEAGSPDSAVGWTFGPGHVCRWVALFTCYLEVRGLMPPADDSHPCTGELVPALARPPT